MGLSKGSFKVSIDTKKRFLSLQMNISHLRSRGMTTLTIDYLLWHYFGRHHDSINQDMLESFRSYFAHNLKATNLAALIESWIAFVLLTHLHCLNSSIYRRTPIAIQRKDEHNPMATTLQCPVLQLVGDGSPHIDETTDLNSKLDPSKSDWMKVT